MVSTWNVLEQFWGLEFSMSSGWGGLRGCLADTCSCEVYWWSKLPRGVVDPLLPIEKPANENT